MEFKLVEEKKNIVTTTLATNLAIAQSAVPRLREQQKICPCHLWKEK